MLQRQLDEAKAVLDEHAELAALVDRGFFEPAREEADVGSRVHEL